MSTSTNGYGNVKLFIVGRDGTARYYGDCRRAIAEDFARDLAKVRKHPVVLQYSDMSERLVRKNGYVCARHERTPRKKRKPRTALRTRRQRQQQRR